MDFAEVRNYQAGDEIRHMEWRMTARTGRPHIKLYQEEKERPILILVDFSSSMFFGTRVALKSVLASRLAALLAWRVIISGDKLGGFLYSQEKHHEFTLRTREKGAIPFLAGLSSYSKLFFEDMTLDKDVSLSFALEKIKRVLRPGSILILISDFYHIDKITEQYLNRLSSHNQIIAYHVCDVLELNPPAPGRYGLTDGKKELLIDTQSKKMKDTYNHYVQDHILKIQKMCKQSRIKLYQMNSYTNIPQLVGLSLPSKRGG